MKITTWNINGVRARIEGALAYVRDAKPDVLCLQEIKTVDEGFPADAFADLGYSVVTHGQKGFNGVALLSLHPPEDVIRGLPGDDGDVQARYIEATITEGALSVRVASIYLPNGNPVASDKFAYKLAWMARLEAHAEALLATEMPVVLAGDFNVIPEPQDAKRPEAWRGDALFQPESRSAFRALGHVGYLDALRACHPEPGHYTFWDYQAGAWQKDDGIRIDFQMLSPQAADRLTASGIDRFTRSWEKPSDHVPVWTTLA
ncbi:MAG: exodeoxyribonuclease III [Hyphomicrobium sp.]|uniref:exodeoxyribonuclease III n=1 Tax=Hyphomicrobium sp. TaxID=82 RepID=UPI003D0F7632